MELMDLPTTLLPRSSRPDAVAWCRLKVWHKLGNYIERMGISLTGGILCSESETIIWPFHPHSPNPRIIQSMGVASLTILHNQSLRECLFFCLETLSSVCKVNLVFKGKMLSSWEGNTHGDSWMGWIGKQEFRLVILASVSTERIDRKSYSMAEVTDSDYQQTVVFLPHSGNSEDSILLRRQLYNTFTHNSKGNWKTRPTKRELLRAQILQKWMVWVLTLDKEYHLTAVVADSKCNMEEVAEE